MEVDKLICIAYISSALGKTNIFSQKSKFKAPPFFKIGRNNNTNILNDKNVVFPMPKAWLVLVIWLFDIKVECVMTDAVFLSDQLTCQVKRIFYEKI